MDMSSPPQSRRGCRGQRPRRGGWCAVFVGDESNHRYSGAQRRVGLFPRSKPPDSPLVQGGDAIFIERGAATRHEKLSCKSPPWVKS